VKQIQAYILAFLFLLPGVGLHLDLSFCCGQLDSIAITHQTSDSISDCCSIDVGESCGTKVELILPQQLIDVATADALDFPALQVIRIPYLKAPQPISITSIVADHPYGEESKEPPTQAGLQVFLC